MTGVGNLGEKIAIKIINDFLNFKSSMCDATTQSLSRYCTYPVSEDAACLEHTVVAYAIQLN